MILIAMQMPDASLVAGYQEWKKLNRFVKKGEKGIQIIAPINSKKDGKIVIQKDMSDVQTIKTMIHELTHSMLHCENGIAEDADRQTKEVQAESVAFIVSSYFGIDTSDYSFGYITGWSQGKNTSILKENLEIITNQADMLISFLEESLSKSKSKTQVA